MKVLYIANYQSPSLIARRHIKQNRALGGSTKVEAFARAIAQANHQVDILGWGVPAERSGRIDGSWVDHIPGNGLHQDIPIYYQPSIDFRGISRAVAFAGMAWSMRTLKHDLVWIYNLPWEHVALGMRSWLAGVPVVLEYEDDVVSSLHGDSGHEPLGKVALKLAQRFVSGVVAVNAELADQINHSNTIIVPGAVDDSIFELPKHSVPKRDEPLRLAYAGGITETKGVLVLIEAVRKLKRPYKLSISGGGPLLEEVKRRTDGDPNITVLGEVNRQQMVEALGEAHIAINPHLTDQGQPGLLFPFKIAEYVAAGCAVVSSPLGIIPDYLHGTIHVYSDSSPDSIAHAIESVGETLEERLNQIEPARQKLRSMVAASTLSGRLDNVLQTALTLPRSVASRLDNVLQTALTLPRSVARGLSRSTKSRV